MTDTLESRLAQLQGSARALVQAARILDQRRHILEPLLRNEEIKTALAEKINGTYGAHAFNHLVPLLAQDLVRDLARLLLDADQRAVSLMNVHRKASEPRVHEALIQQFGAIPDKWHEDRTPIEGLSQEVSDKLRAEWRDQDRDRFLKSFDDGWREVESAIKRLGADATTEKIRTFRNKYLAHYEMSPLGADPGPYDLRELGLTYDELLAYADSYLPAVFELGRVLTGNVIDVKAFSEVHNRYATDMWRTLASLTADENDGNNADRG